VRLAFTVLVGVWLCLPGNVLAQEQPTGPLLQPSDTTPAMCDPNALGFRYVEVRGTGFDTSTNQHLVGSLLDPSGDVRQQWPNILVTPQGRLTLEINLCSDPIQNRPALEAGDYTVAVGQNDGDTLASIGFSLAPIAAPPTSGELPAPQSPAPEPTPAPDRTGPGSRQQPLPLGAGGELVDGWQLVIQSVEPDAFEHIKSAVPSALPPAPDKRYLLVRTMATYVGPGTGVLGASRIALLNPASQQTYNQIADNCGAIAGALPATVVSQGTTISGDVCFAVRASDIGSLLAFDNQQHPADRVYFALQ
jgi:hypothetical protein